MKTNHLDKLKNKDGSLTVYAFACGYIQLHEEEDFEIRLEKDSACCHIKVYHDDEGKVVWLSYTRLSYGRFVFNSIKRMIKKLEFMDFIKYCQNFPEV